ncbi:hypothetical protein [Streptomyces hydrogenans]|uniref:hypothetical protein n=1 Tax=Streptomyces hydrogenans TaxID=1873719 RepID=UPI003416C409
MNPYDLPLTVHGLFQAEDALRALLRSALGDRPMSAEAECEIANRTECSWPQALLHIVPDSMFSDEELDRLGDVRDRIYDDILPTLNGCFLDDPVEQLPEFAYMPMPEDAAPRTLCCIECGRNDKGMVLLTHTRGHHQVSVVVCRSHHDDDRTRRWLAQQNQPTN